MHEPVYLVNPVFEVVFWFVLISWLRAASRETVGAVVCPWYVY